MLLELDIFNPNTDEEEFDGVYELAGRSYFINAKWCPRDGYWYLRLSDQDEQPIAQGIKCVVGTSLLRRFTDPRLPPGALTINDMLKSGRSPGRYDLGTDAYPLIYWDGDPADADG